MKNQERNRHALKLRRGGLTFREIGERIGVSSERARSIVRKQEARLNARIDPLERALREFGRKADATRIMNALHFAGLYQGDPGGLAACLPEDLAKIAHIGLKSLELIEKALCRLRPTKKSTLKGT